MYATTKKKSTGTHYLISQFAQDSGDEWHAIEKIAEAVGRHKTAVWRWTQPKSKGGTDGRVPTSILPEVLQAAKKLKIKLDMQRLLDY